MNRSKSRRLGLSRGFINRRLATGAAFLAVTLVAVVVISVGSAAPSPTKPYTAVFATSVPGGSTNADVTLTINNLSSSQSLGSANVTAASNSAAAFTITGETGAPVDPTQTYPTSLLMLRNLNIAPMSSLTIHISVNTPCATGTYTWGIQAKQSNSFNGPPGNDFTFQALGSNLTTSISTGCHLAFLTQPASASVGAIITDTAYNPTVTGGAGSPQYVAVEAVDGDGNPIASASGTVTLSKAAGTGGSFASADTTASFDSHGIATFPALKSSATGSNLQLKAAATGFGDSDPSSAFNITTGGMDCSGQSVCSGSTTLTNSRVDTTATGTFGFVAIDDVTTIPTNVTHGGGCDHFIGTGTGFEESDTRNGDGTLDFTYYIQDRALKQAYGTNYGQPNVPICAGGRVVVDNHPVDCNDPAYPGQTGWYGRHLGTDGKFDGTYRRAVCDPATGYWWGILGTKQDPNPPIDPTIDPSITGWGSTTIYRTFVVHVTAGWDWQMH